MKKYRNTPQQNVLVLVRCPMLWAALAFAAGIFFGFYFWRPATWWLFAAGFFVFSGIYFVGRRAWAASAIGLGALVAIGAFCIQVRPPADVGDIHALQFTDGREVSVTAHIIKEGYARAEPFGNTRRSVDVETELVESGGEVFPLSSGVRLNLYNKEDDEDSVEFTPIRFQYGSRIRFNGKLFAPHNFGNPGAFDYRGYLADNRILVLGSAKISSVEFLDGFSGSKIELWRTRVHRRIVEKIHQMWPAQQASLIDAMVIGEDAFLGQDSRVEFQRSGTYHVLVVSGMNVAILAFVVFWVLRRVRVSDVIASIVVVILAVAYAFLTDVGPPVWRATLMLAIYLGACILYRERSMLNAIGAAAFGVLLVDPKALLGASFQLTFLCVLLVAAIGVPVLERTSQPFLRGLRNLESASYDWVLSPKVAQFRLDLRAVAARFSVVLGKRISLRLLHGLAWIALASFELLCVSAIMQFGLALPMAYYFHRATVVGMPANVLVVPLMQILMPAVVLAVALGFVSLAAAKIPALLAGVVLKLITGTVHWLGALRVADTRVPTPAIAMILSSCILLMIAMSLARRRALLAIAGLCFLIIGALCVALIPPTPELYKGNLEITAIDVGQGDAIFVASPDGHTVLIDAGGTPAWMQSGLDIGENVVSPYLWARRIGHVDTVAITHAHADHMGGMRAVLANFHPRELWLGVDSASPELQAILRQARESGVKIIQHKAGDEFSFGRTDVRVLAPGEDVPASRQNDESLVLRISYENTSALLEGDAERQTEKQIAEEQPQADLLKVAHHGSTTSTIPELLAAVRPRFAVISVGVRNVYGHPRREVLDRLRAAGVATYRTDLDGAVSFYLDGRNVTPDLPALH